MPYPDIKRSVSILDNRRLGKQRVEVWQIYLVLQGKSKGWKNHPAVLMWLGHERMLLEYGHAASMEWKRRGFQDILAARFKLHMKRHRSRKLPAWWGRKDVHSSHRANLLRKDAVHYGRFGWKERPREGYVWPVTASSARRQSRA